MISNMLVSQLSESALLDAIFPILPRGAATTVPAGDDSAVLTMTGQTTVSTDMLVEGRHFTREWFSGYDVGARAAVQNIADAVAMGAQPRTLVVALGLPSDLDAEWVSDFARGLADVCEPLGVGVDGGDLVGASEIAVSVTVLGDMEGREPLLRRGAQVGDRVLHAGNLGKARAGYEILNAGIEVSPELAELVERFRRPEPPFEVALAAARRGALHAMMDVSDGLVMDARRMAKASGVWMDLGGSELLDQLGPLAIAAGRVRANRLEWLLTGGEDHGFLATCSHDAEVPTGFVVIGEVRAASLGGRVTVGGRELQGAGGWDHFGGE